MTNYIIEGPDDDGYVWLKSLPGAPNAWGHNLGKVEDAAEVFSQWLGSIDYGELQVTDAEIAALDDALFENARNTVFYGKHHEP